MKIKWSKPDGKYSIVFNPKNLNFDDCKCLAFSSCQSPESNNLTNSSQEFELHIHDELGHSFNTGILLPYYKKNIKLDYPDIYLEDDQESKSYKYPLAVFQTFMVDFDTLSKEGVSPEKITCLEFYFNKTISGTIYFDGIWIM